MDKIESIEDYLEAILVLQKEHHKVRSIDIANYMDYSRASISIAIKKLKALNFIIVNVDSTIDLTEKGLSIASKTYERHTVLATAMMSLGVSEQTALKDACKIEHDISDETFNKLKEHISKHNNSM